MRCIKPSIKIAFFLSCILFCRCYSITQDIKPNIIIIVADDLGWNDISLNGSNIKTPNIDRLISEGAKLNRFYTTPICSPTQAGLLSGQYPDRFGIRDGVISPRVKGGMPSQVTTIAEMLAQTGYKKRAAFGKWHLGHANLAFHPLQQGFTSFYGHYNGALDYFTHERAGELDWQIFSWVMKPWFHKSGNSIKGSFLPLNLISWKHMM